MRAIRDRISYANVVSTLALFLVVAGGSAFAANQLAKNSVGAKQLKKNAVTAAKIKKNAVTTAKVKNGSLRAIDFAPGQLPAGAPHATGPRGPQGQSGDRGEAGKQGAKGDTGPAGSVAMLARINGIPSTATQQLTYGAPSGISTADTDEGDVSMLSPDIALLATGLAVQLTEEVNNNSARRFTLVVDGIDSALSCTIGSFGSSCTSSASVPVPAASTIAIKSDRPAAFNTIPTDARIAFQLTQ